MEAVAASDEWKDISTEMWREYQFPNSETVRVTSPVRFKVSKHQEGDAHRVEAADGRGYYIRAGWLAIRWQVKPGAQTVTV